MVWYMNAFFFAPGGWVDGAAGLCVAGSLTLMGFFFFCIQLLVLRALVLHPSPFGARHFLRLCAIVSIQS